MKNRELQVLTRLGELYRGYVKKHMTQVFSKESFQWKLTIAFFLPP